MNVEVFAYFWIIVDEFRKWQDQVDDVLCNNVSRSCLTTKDDSDFAFWKVSFFDFQVFVDDIQSVHLLTFVFVETFDLCINDWVFIKIDTFVGFKITFKRQFVIIFNFSQTFVNCWIICKGSQFFQLSCVSKVTITNQFFDVVSKFLVWEFQPTTECNTVCFVVEAFWVKVVEWFQLRRFKDFCVKCCYTVNACREVDIHVCHVNTVVFVNDLNTWIFEFFTNDSIQFLDDNNKVWNNFFKVVKRPFFKGFSQDSVVCVTNHFAYDCYCFIKFKSMFFCQKTDQFWNYHWWVSIVDLYVSVIWKIVKIRSTFDSFVDQKLSSVWYHEVLLVDT